MQLLKLIKRLSQGSDMRSYWSMTRARDADTARELQQHASRHRHSSGHEDSPIDPARMQQQQSKYPSVHTRTHDGGWVRVGRCRSDGQ